MRTIIATTVAALAFMVLPASAHIAPGVGGLARVTDQQYAGPTDPHLVVSGKIKLINRSGEGGRVICQLILKSNEGETKKLRLGANLADRETRVRRWQVRIPYTGENARVRDMDAPHCHLGTRVDVNDA